MDYNVPPHVYSWAKREIEDYRKNKKRFKHTANRHTDELIAADKRLRAIETVMNNLDDDEMNAAQKIFFERRSWEYMVDYGWSKSAYYNLKNKVIYHVAKEMELI